MTMTLEVDNSTFPLSVGKPKPKFKQQPIIAKEDITSSAENEDKEDVLSALAKHLDESALQSRSFLVDVSGTSIDEEHISEQFTKPQILFVDVNVGQLDYFLHGLKRKTDRKKSIFRKKAQLYKSVSSTENETLLFPDHIDTELCRRIAICLAEQRTC